MPTTVDLGKLVKAKYPGQYDDLPDADVGTKVKAKFPGAYDDFTDASAIPGTEKLGLPPATKPPLPGGLKGAPEGDDSITKSLWNTTGAPVVKLLKSAGSPIGSIYSAGKALLTGNPKELATPMRESGEIAQGLNDSLVKQPWEYAKKTGNAMLHGDVMGTIRNAPGMVPGFGPAAEHVADEADKGHWRNATGEAIGLVGQAIAPEVAPKVVRAAASGIEKLTPAVDSIKTMVRAVKPISTDLKFEPNLARSMPEVKAAESQLGHPIAGVDDALAATKLAKKAVWGQYEQMRGAGIEADFNAVAKQLRADGKPGAAVAVKQLGLDYQTNAMRLDVLESELAKTNAQLNSYYAKYPSAQRTAATANPDTAALVSKAEALRDTIYRTLDSDAGGAAPRELKQRYGALLDLEKQLERRRNVAARQQPQGLTEQMGGLYAAGRLARGLVRMKADPAGAAADILEAGASRVAAKAIKESQTTDALIAKAFKNYKQEPVPVQMPSATPAMQTYGPIGPPAPGAEPIQNYAMPWPQKKVVSAGRGGGRGNAFTTDWDASQGGRIPRFARGGIVRKPTIAIVGDGLRPPKLSLPGVKSPEKQLRHNLNSLAWRNRPPALKMPASR